MFVIDFFKRLLNCFRTKKLNEAKNEIIQTQIETPSENSEEIDFFDSLEQVETLANLNNIDGIEFNDNEKVKSEKVQIIMEEFLDNKRITNRVGNYNDVEIVALKNNLLYLAGLNYSKRQIGKMIEKNSKILFMSEDELKRRFFECELCIGDIGVALNIISRNSSLLNMSDKLNNLYYTMHKYGFEQEEINNLIYEEPTIVSIDTDVLDNSINVFKELYGDNYKKVIFEFPSIIGAIDVEFIRSSVVTI